MGCAWRIHCLDPPHIDRGGGRRGASDTLVEVLPISDDRLSYTSSTCLRTKIAPLQDLEPPLLKLLFATSVSHNAT